ncbi:TetR family transcriptional regulator [Streptomyces sp. DSM 44917]|uniref:TetR family transcriptional regulator n=1 Tax=Streptomyces boetiae TaxID=3075541 RepID=A0ABU2L5H5_9ACTN|nr:TetR family transcriptional regulator [Streptomyces sp. DSM 44917]MDT0306622.1 TetR family transcriptional regulator [Streptomyces sp. DSM 44917]
MNNVSAPAGGERTRTRGRPPGNPPTRERIAEVARGLFLERGYRGTTLRAVAAAAGVDSALIAYHFGSKQGLFGEALRVRCGQSLAVAEALAAGRGGGPAELADRLLRAITDLGDDPAPGDPLSGFGRMALGADEEALPVLREFLEREVLARIAEYLGGPDATERATAAMTLMGGLIFTRYLNPLGPVAALSPEEVRRILGPALRAALAGPRRPARFTRPERPAARTASGLATGSARAATAG